MKIDELRQVFHQAHRGDRDAAVRLYRATAPRMLAYARALCRHDAAAEDAVQQVFIRLLKTSRAQIAAVDDPLAWLIRLVRNTILNDARASARALRRDRAHERSRPDPSAGPVRRDDLLAIISRLPDEQRELIVLKHVVEMTFDQMALSLDVNRNTLASRYRAAIDGVRAAFPQVQGVPHD